ncbi:hypothetical protein SteCoe_16905 [Stentor coeruleus]|uniref:Uncharacterized protein n=1 Tax=Stentor coeruleus TaxID=5963 RepID=A0A1R2C086_9CILI|nr:hypothetical protein SteCoe_16905 [Stentor coeruleus]
MSSLLKIPCSPERGKRESSNGKHEIIFASSNNLMSRLEKNKKDLSRRSPFSSSPYAIKLTNSCKNLNTTNKIPSLKMMKKTNIFVKDTEKTVLANDTGPRFSFSSTVYFDDNSKSRNKSNFSDEVEKMISSINDQMEKSAKFEACRAAFDEVIEKDKDFSPVLQIIKREYEKIIKSSKSHLERKTKLLDDLERARSYLSSELECCVTQNRELICKIDYLNTKCKAFTCKLTQLAETDINSLEQNDINWKKLIEENLLYRASTYNLEKDLAYYRSKASKMMKLISVIEKSGYPVEEVYKYEVRNKTNVPYCKDNNEILDTTEHENIITGRLPEIIKPVEVPRLNLRNYQIDCKDIQNKVNKVA